MMSFSARYRLLALVLAASSLSCAGLGDDMAAPDPGVELTASSPSDSSVWLHWDAATDDTTSAASLEYSAYFSARDNLDSVANVLANGTQADEWRADLTRLRVERLALDTTYFFNVLVRDEAGNMAVYGGASATTLGGTWRDAEALEDYEGDSVRATSLAVRQQGDVVAYWEQHPGREAHFATRAPEADTFGAPAPWSAANVHTPTLAYGFDGRLMGASLRHNDDGTSDVRFGSRVEGEQTTFETLATGLVTEFTWQTLACVAENGDAMVVWLDSTSHTSDSLRARFRTNATWGATSLVSETEGLFIFDIHVVCSPQGNHMVVYGVDDETSRQWLARVYDADRDDWEAPATPLEEDGYQGQLSSARTVDGRVVVAWQTDIEDVVGAFLRARIYEAGGWSTLVHTLSHDQADRAHSLRLAAAGNDVHAVWRVGDRLRTRRLEAGSAAWSLDVPFGPVANVQEFCLAGDPLGGVLLAWTASHAVDARIYSPRSESWGPVQSLKEAGESIGYLSLGCIVNPQRRATVVWTEWDPPTEHFSALRANVPLNEASDRVRPATPQERGR